MKLKLMMKRKWVKIMKGKGAIFYMLLIEQTKYTESQNLEANELFVA